MSVAKKKQKTIQVCAHWQGMPEPVLMGILSAFPSRGKEIFSFEYDKDWLKSKYSQTLDPHLVLFGGPQYTRHDNFGLFLDSAPDHWGRVLMQRREAQLARDEKREIRTLLESDYLLGVYDAHRMGSLRFRLSPTRPFLHDKTEMASPPWTRLPDLEYASLQLERAEAEKDNDYMKWLNLLIAPGGSLGGARPKAGVLDENGRMWIAKFPSRSDETNIGAWEYLVYQLSVEAGIETAPSMKQCFSGEHDTFLTKRFDRTDAGERVHFASAMALLGKKDGDSGETGVSYLDLAEFLIKNGAQTDKDLEQLWWRIVFNICVSNLDDHLRNHGFLLQKKGWILSPAYDMNPSATGDGLTLNISKKDNSQNLDLALEVAPLFRIKQDRAQEIIGKVITSVKKWSGLAKKNGLSSREIELMRHPFRVVERS